MTVHLGAGSVVKRGLRWHRESFTSFLWLVDHFLTYEKAPVTSIEPWDAIFIWYTLLPIVTCEFLAVWKALAKFTCLPGAVYYLAVLDLAIDTSIGPNLAICWNLRCSLCPWLQDIQYHCYLAVFVRVVDKIRRIRWGYRSMLQWRICELWLGTE